MDTNGAAKVVGDNVSEAKPDTKDDLVSFLEEKWGDKGCPRCSANRFALPGRTGVPAIKKADNIWVLDTDKMLLAEIVVCLNCGYVMTVSTEIYEQWKKVKNG